MENDLPLNIKYYDKSICTTEGSAFAGSLKENEFDRLPAAYKSIVRLPVWNLSKCSTGLSVNFSSNSTSIWVRWTLLKNSSMPHMASTGIKGVDLYCREKNDWRYINTGQPTSLVNEFNLVSNMESQWRDYKLYLPIYDGIEILEIGIDNTGGIKPAIKETTRPIIFYGTSMTQGACVSRPGMTYVNILSRRLNIPCINFGFDKNGMMEPEIIKLISEIDAEMYIIDCTINMDSVQIMNRMLPLVEEIRKERLLVPIVFVEALKSRNATYDLVLNFQENSLNNALHAGYQDIYARGFQNIYYISNQGFTDTDHESTVDGTHFNDLGSMRMALFLETEIRKILPANEKENQN